MRKKRDFRGKKRGLRGKKKSGFGENQGSLRRKKFCFFWCLGLAWGFFPQEEKVFCGGKGGVLCFFLKSGIL